MALLNNNIKRELKKQMNDSLKFFIFYFRPTPRRFGGNFLIFLAYRMKYILKRRLEVDDTVDKVLHVPLKMSKALGKRKMKEKREASSKTNLVLFLLI